MKSTIYLWTALGIFLGVSGAGCEVTSEKISLWKQSDKGAAKLRAALRDTRQKIAIRVEAAEALGEIGLFAPLAEDFKAISGADRQGILDELTKRLVGTMKGSNPKATTKVQLQAKDTLVSVRDFASDALRGAIDEEVVRWLLGDWGNRSGGEHSADKVIKTIGAKAGPILAENVAADPALCFALATLLRESGDTAVRDTAAVKLIELARRETGDKVERVISALGKVGSLKAAAYLEAVAQQGSKEQRIWALQALHNHFPHAHSIPVAKAIASDTSLKEDLALVRDEAFTLLERIADPQSLEALLGFLGSKEEKVRYRAVEAAIAGFKVKGLPKLLAALPASYTYKKGDLKDYIEDDIVKLGTSALPPMREALASKSWITRLIAVRVLGAMGTKADAAAVEQLTSDATKLRGWEGGATIGSEAKAAAEKMKTRD